MSGRVFFRRGCRHHIFLLSRVLLLVLISIFPLALAVAEEEDGHAGIVYGENHAFTITAPKGWILDNQSGVSQGLHAVFYRKGESWKNGTAVMYVNTARRENSQSILSFIEDDTRRFRERDSEIKIEVGKSLITADGKTAEVRYFSGDQWDNREAVAYIEEKNIFVIIVLTSRTKEEFARSESALADLVGSYTFMTDAVIISPPED